MASSKNFGNWKVSLLCAFCFVLFACDQDVKIVDGHVPAEYLPYVQPLMGDYTGQFNRQANTLTARLSGDVVELTTQQDLLGSGCRTQIGKLTQISYAQKDNASPVLTQAIFDLDPNLCSQDVIGQKLYVTLQSSKTPVKLNLAVLEGYRREWECSGLATTYPGPGYPYPPGQPHCWMNDVPVFMVGRFVKN